MTKTGQI